MVGEGVVDDHAQAGEVTDIAGRNGAAVNLGSGGDEQVRDRRRAMLARSARSICRSIARAWIAGVMCSTGVNDRGGSPSVLR